MLQVNLEDVKKWHQFRKQCNTTPLKDIEYLWKGKPVGENPIMTENGKEVILSLDEWLYTGLSNIDYMLMLLNIVDESFDEGYIFTSEIINPDK